MMTGSTVRRAAGPMILRKTRAANWAPECTEPCRAVYGRRRTSLDPGCACGEIAAIFADRYQKSSAMSAEPLLEFAASVCSDVEAERAAALSLQQLGVPYPIIVGVTGHRDIAPAGIPAVRSAVRAVLDELRGVFRDALHVMTALADGADAAQPLADEHYGQGRV
jgi:hypothetical protein